MQLLAINQQDPDQLDVTILFCLLSEREPHQNISHKKMPTYMQHEDFVKSCPYEFWYLIQTNHGIVGTVYLTRNREIGVHIFKRDRSNGYGKQAVELLKQKHPGDFLANINPSNLPSISMFRQLGFEKLQVTYALKGASA